MDRHVLENAYQVAGTFNNELGQFCNTPTAGLIATLWLREHYFHSQIHLFGFNFRWTWGPHNKDAEVDYFMKLTRKGITVLVRGMPLILYL